MTYWSILFIFSLFCISLQLNELLTILKNTSKKKLSIKGWSFHWTDVSEDGIIQSENHQQTEYTLSNLLILVQPYLPKDKQIHCILKASLEDDPVFIYVSFKYAQNCFFFTDIAAIPDVKNQIDPNNYEDCLNFTMKTVNIKGITQMFINMIEPELSLSDYKIVNIGNHFIGYVKRGEIALIYDSCIPGNNPFYTKKENLQKVFQCETIEFFNSPQQHDNVSCGLYSLFCAVCLKENLPITPTCANISDNVMFLKDLYNTFLLKKMTKEAFLHKYYRGTRIQAKVPDPVPEAGTAHSLPHSRLQIEGQVEKFEP